MNQRIACSQIFWCTCSSNRKFPKQLCLYKLWKNYRTSKGTSSAVRWHMQRLSQWTLEEHMGKPGLKINGCKEQFAPAESLIGSIRPYSNIQWEQVFVPVNTSILSDLTLVLAAVGDSY